MYINYDILYGIVYTYVCYVNVTKFEANEK